MHKANRGKRPTEVLNFMRRHDLHAINTKFRKKKQSHATYIHVVSNGSGHDQYVGREAKIKWRGQEHIGKVVENFRDANGARRWRVKFDDGYVGTYAEPDLNDILVVVQKKTQGKQLDYIMVNNRWLTSVQDSGVSWAPSWHRNIKGRADHALVYGKWTWRIQKPPKKVVRNFLALNPNTPDGQALISKFDSAIEKKALEISCERQTIEQQYENLCMAIDFAMQSVLPTRTKTKCTTRTVSQRTKALFEKRTSMGKSDKKWSNADYDKIQLQIRKSSLQDHAEWVGKCADEMQEANDVGDTRKLYAVVKTLSGKIDKKPPTDINVNAQGSLISSAEERADTWYEFLKNKFAAIKAEQARLPMAPLQGRDPGNTILDEEVRAAVSSLKNHKAVGADGIPVEIYKVSPAAFMLLSQLLQRIWREEKVPEKTS